MDFFQFFIILKQNLRRLKVILSFNTFILIFIGIGVVVGYYFSFLLLLHQKGNKKANRFLAAFTFTVSYFLTVKLIINGGLYTKFPELLGTAFIVWFLTGPMFIFI